MKIVMKKSVKQKIDEVIERNGDNIIRIELSICELTELYKDMEECQDEHNLSVV